MADKELFGNSEQLDTISRQAVVDLVEEVENKRLKGEIDLTYAPMINGIKALPSSQPERKKGKWIEYNATGKKQWMCSECCAEEKNPKVARFCYWCGAYMRGEQDG